MKIKFLGGTNEVGRSAFLVNSNNIDIVLDYGVKVETEEFPLTPEKVDAIIPTHSHLDHNGGLPSLYRENLPMLYLTSISLELTKLLIKDFIKIAKKDNRPLKFTDKDVNKMLREVKIVNYNQPFFVNNVKCALFDAGHIPGSASVLLEVENKKIFYTGDIKLESTRLVNGCKLPEENIDALIIESTYSDRNHPNRIKQEEKFKDEIDQALNNNEIALVPVFAVGRAQEILLILKDYANYIALDGMAKEATEIILGHKKYLSNYTELKKIFNKIKRIENNKQRDSIIKKPCIIITTAGMLSGGPVVHYIKKIHERKESRILLTGFQVEETPGKTLLDTGVFKNEDIEIPVRCKVSKFDFSSHAGKSELFEIIKKLKPKKVFCVHGDKCREFAKDIKNNFKVDAYAPEIGEEVKI